jgi:hypothetical protein
MDEQLEQIRLLLERMNIQLEAINVKQDKFVLLLKTMLEKLEGM